MGKLAVAGASVLAGGGVSAGGVMLSRMFSFDSSLPISLAEFKKTDGGGCVQSLFPDLGKMDGTGATDADTTDNNKVKKGLLNKDKESEGCLVINWDKEEHKSGSDTNWTNGKFRLLWAVQQKDDKGFIVFATATTKNDSEKKLDLKGVAYSTKWEATENKWKFSKKKEVDSNKTLDTSSVENKFPKAKSDLTSKSFWGFMENKDDLNKMCESSSGCTGDKTPRFFEGYWEWKGTSNSAPEGKEKLGEWTSSLDGWWGEWFGKDKWDMPDVVQEMKGNWKNRVWYGIDK